MTKLLLDQNLSFKICKKIEDIFPEAKHVSDVRLNGSDDLSIWNYAKNNNFTIVTFDSDFIDISALNGFPPKIIWIRTGNTTSEIIIQKIKLHEKVIKEFQSDSENAYLELA